MSTKAKSAVHPKSTVSPGILAPLLQAMQDDRGFLGVILALAVGLPLLHLHFIKRMAGFDIPIMDSLDYVTTANDLLDPNIIPEPFYHSPLYACFVAAVFKIFGHKLAVVHLMQVVLHAATALLMYATGRRFLSRNVGRISSLIYCLYGPILFFNTEILNVALILFLNVLGIALVIRAWEAPSLMRWGTAGVVLGLAVLVRADALVFMLLVAAAIFLFQRASNLTIKNRLFNATAAVAGTVVLLLAVGLHNKSAGGGFKMLPDNGKLNFFQGNNPQYKKTIGIRIASWYTLSHMPLAEGVGTELNELGHGAFYFSKATQFITQQPAEWLGCVAYKLRALVNGYELPETFDVYRCGRHSPLLAALAWHIGPFYFPFALLFPLALLGAWLARKNQNARWLYVYVIAMLVSLLGYWNSARYRLGIAPVLIFWAAIALDWFWQKYRAKEMPRIAMASGALLLLSIPALWPIDHFSKTFNFEAETRAMAGLELMKTQPERGLQLLHEAAEMDPNSYFAHNNLGLGLLDSDQPDEAIVHFTKAVEIYPQYYIGYDNLGRSWGRKNQPAQAEQAFRRVLEIYPRAYQTLYNLGVALMQQNKRTEAMESFKRATEINPAYVDAYNNWGSLLLQENRLDEAQSIFQRILQIDPSYEKAQANLQLVAERRQK